MDCILIRILLAAVVLSLSIVSCTNTSGEVMPEVPGTVEVVKGDVQQIVIAPGQLVNAREVSLGMEANGPLGEIFVQPGDHVKTGQLLAVLGNGVELAAAVEAARYELISAELALQEIYEGAPLKAAQAELDLANARVGLEVAKYNLQVHQDGSWASQAMIDEAEAKLVLAEDELERAAAEYERYTRRSEDDPERAKALYQYAVARQSYQAALQDLTYYTHLSVENQQVQLHAEVVMAEAKVAEAERWYELIKNGPDTSVLARAEAHLDMAATQLYSAEAASSGSELYAPFSGVILEVNAKPGENVAAGSGFITLADVGELEVFATVIEEDYPKLRIGQPVILFFDARPDAEIRGSVDRIVPRKLPGDRPLYGIFISFYVPTEGLVQGMTVDASIIIAQRDDVLRLPKSIVRGSSDGTATVEIWTSGIREERTVSIGLRGDTYVEILNGLDEGDQVILE
jgi:HlyD family secretion protein